MLKTKGVRWVQACVTASVTALSVSSALSQDSNSANCAQQSSGELRCQVKLRNGALTNAPVQIQARLGAEPAQMGMSARSEVSVGPCGPAGARQRAERVSLTGAWTELGSYEAKQALMGICVEAVLTECRDKQGQAISCDAALGTKIAAQVK